MVVASTQPIEPARLHPADQGPIGPLIDRPDLIVPADEDETQGISPWMVMQTPVGIRVDETVEIKMPVEQADEVVAFEIGLSLVALDETTGTARTDPGEEGFDHGEERSIQRRMGRVLAIDSRAHGRRSRPRASIERGRSEVARR
jgi:hypothetical protein